MILDLYVSKYYFIICCSVLPCFFVSTPSRDFPSWTLPEVPRGLVDLELILLRCGIGAKGAKVQRRGRRWLVAFCLGESFVVFERKP